MSISAGPNSITNNLVLCLDSSNFRSFRGEPTTNIINYSSIGANRYNNPGISGSIVNTGKTFLGSPIWEATFIPQDATRVSNLGSTEGFGFLHSMGQSLLANTQYMASIYFQTRYPLLSSASQGFDHGYSNIPGWRYDNTTSTRYPEGEWIRLYSKYFNSININNENYASNGSTNILNAIVNTTQTTDILLTITLLSNGTFSTSTDFGISTAGGTFTQYSTLVGILSANPTITSNGGISGLSTGSSAIIQHGLDTTNWTKLSTTNFLLKNNFPTTYYVLVRIPSTNGSNVTIGFRPQFGGFYTSLTDGKYWKITFNNSNLQIGNVIRTYWAAPMIEQHNRNLPSKFTIGTRGSDITTGGGWLDLSKNNNNVIISQTPTFNTSNNGSLIFNGTNEYVIVSNMSRFSSNSDITIEAYINPYSLQSYSVILERGYSSPGYPSYALRRQSGYGWSILIGDSINNYSATDLSEINLNNWQHVIGILDRSNNLLKIYVNGILKATGDATGLGSFENAASNLTIARAVTDVSYSYFHGAMSMIRIYNRALSESEVKQNFESLRGRFGL